MQIRPSVDTEIHEVQQVIFQRVRITESVMPEILSLIGQKTHTGVFYFRRIQTNVFSVGRASCRKCLEVGHRSD